MKRKEKPTRVFWRNGSLFSCDLEVGNLLAVNFCIHLLCTWRNLPSLPLLLENVKCNIHVHTSVSLGKPDLDVVAKVTTSGSIKNLQLWSKPITLRLSCLCTNLKRISFVRNHFYWTRQTEMTIESNADMIWGNDTEKVICFVYCVKWRIGSFQLETGTERSICIWRQLQFLVTYSPHFWNLF